MLKLDAIRKQLPALCVLAVAGVAGVAVAAPAKGTTIVSPSIIVVSPAATPASGVAPTKGSGSTTGLPAGGPPIIGIAPPPLPPAAPVGP